MPPPTIAQAHALVAAVKARLRASAYAQFIAALEEYIAFDRAQGSERAREHERDEAVERAGVRAAALLRGHDDLVRELRAFFPPSAFADTAHIVVREELAVALVTRAPRAPGHVTVAPRRAVARFGDMSPAEVAAVWTLAQRVGRAM